MKNIILIASCLFSLSLFAEWKKENFENSYAWIYYPKNLLNTTLNKNALMLNLHGCSQKPEDLKNDGNWTTTADDYNMIVVLPLVPNGGKYMGCWDYYGADHTRSNRDNVFLINLVNNLLSRKELNLDTNQVYVSGLSSGGGESMVLGCLAPDIFSGIGLNAGPSAGTTANEINSGPKSMDLPVSTCLKLASNSNNQDQFKTQLTSIIYGSNDFIVNPKHDTTNAEVMSSIYGAKNKSTFDTKKIPGTNNDGNGTFWSDENGPRISLIMNSNLGHNWPAGQGGNGGNFINKKSINYPQYLTKYFFENNRKTKNVNHPILSIANIEVKDNQLWLSGRTNINNIQRIIANVIDKKTGYILGQINLNLNQDGTFEGLSPSLNNGEYDLIFNVATNSGESRTFYRNAWIGEIPNLQLPQLFNVNFMAQDDCLLIRGQAVNNGEVKTTEVQLWLDGVSIGKADIQNTFWGTRFCSLSKGVHELIAFAVNENGQSSNQSIHKFTIGLDQVTSNLFEHMSARRLRWEEYGVWYAKYQNKEFTLFKNSNGQWTEIKN